MTAAAPVLFYRASERPFGAFSNLFRREMGGPAVVDVELDERVSAGSEPLTVALDELAWT